MSLLPPEPDPSTPEGRRQLEERDVRLADRALELMLSIVAKAARGELQVPTSDIEACWRMLAPDHRDRLEAALRPVFGAGLFRETAPDGACNFCGEATDSLAGNPGRWPVRLPAGPEPGVMKPHHMTCVMSRLRKEQP